MVFGKTPFLFLAAFVTANAYSNCESTLKQDQRKETVEFARNIHKTNPEFYKNDAITHEQERLKKIGLKPSSQPHEIIADWLEALEKTHSSAFENEKAKARIEKYYFDENIIKFEEIPESYYESQRRIAREQGHGNIILNSQTKKSLLKV